MEVFSVLYRCDNCINTAVFSTMEKAQKCFTELLTEKAEEDAQDITLTNEWHWESGDGIYTILLYLSKLDPEDA